MRTIECLGALVLLLATVLGSPAAQDIHTFRWLDRGTDKTVFRRIEAAFHTELEPDKAVGGPVHLLKYIDRVGMVDSSALVVIGHKEGNEDPYPNFKVYTFNLKTGQKSAIRREGGTWEWYPEWKFHKLTRFEPSLTDDVTFTYYSCTECDAERFLGAFHFNFATQHWQLRKWGSEGDSLFVGSDPQYAGEGIFFYECLFKVADFTGDGFDDVAVRYTEKFMQGLEGSKANAKLVKDETRLYTARNGKMSMEELKGKAARRVSSILCEGDRKHPLCR